jgi:hypothetical protein
MIRSYLKDCVTIRTKKVDNYGTKENGRERKEKAFIEFKRKWVGVQDGQQLMSEAVVILPDCELSLNDTIEFEGRQWRILSIKKQRDFSNRYLEVAVG